MKNLYRATFEQSITPYLIVSDSDDKTIADANSAACELFGYSKDEITNLTCDQLFLTGLDFENAPVKKSLTGMHQEGNQIVCSCQISSAEQPDGSKVFILQVTGKKAAPKDKGNNSQILDISLLESVITNTNDAILITKASPVSSPDGPEIIYANEAFTELTGYAPDDVIGNTPRLLQGPNTESEELQKLRTAIKNQESTIVELINYKKNGEEFWVNISFNPVFNKNGKCTHFIAIERNITARKYREQLKTLQSDISRIFNEQESVNESIEVVLQIIAEFGKFSLAEVWLVNDDKSSIGLTGYFEQDKSAKLFYRESNRLQFRKGEGMPGITWKTGKIQFWQDLKHHEKFQRRDAIKNIDNEAAYCVPVIYHEEVIGALLLGVRKAGASARYNSSLLKQLGKDLGSEINRKKLEEELNRTFNFSPDVICISGMDGYFKKVNPAMCRLLGYTQDELLSHPISEFTHPDDRIRTETEIDAISQNRGAQKFVNRYITKSGKIIWLSWTTNIVYEEGKIYSIARDITERKELEILLEQANRLAKIGSWEVDLVENTNYWSEITKEIHEVEPEYEPDMHSGINFYKEGESRERIREAVENAIKNGVPFDVEVQIITAKGNELWVRSIGESEMVEGKCVRFYGSIQDINEKKELENLLEQANKLSKIGSWELDLVNNKVYWSDMMYDIFEVNSKFEPTVENNIEFYKEGENRDTMWDVSQKAIHDGKPWDIEVMIVTNSGDEKWVRSIGEAKFVEGDCTRLYGSLQDINQRKEAELAFVEASQEREKILESITDAFYAIDENWNFTYFNHEAENLLGRKAKEVLGKSIWDEFASAAETELYDNYHEVLETQKPKSFEYYYPPLGSWYDISAYPAENGISVYFKTIDERKKAQQQILEKTRQLDVIAYFNSLIIKKDDWRLALDECLYEFGQLVNADRVYYFENESGNRHDQVTISMIMEWVREGITPELENPVNQNLRISEIPHLLEKLSDRNFYHQKEGEVTDEKFRTFLQKQGIKSILKVPVFADNKFRGFIGFDDCTRKRNWSEEEISFLQTISINLGSAIENEDAEVALQQAFTEKNEILESIGDAFFAVDNNWTVTYWNKVAEELLEMPREKTVGENLWDLYEDATSLEFYRQYHKAMEEQVTVHFDEYYLPKDKWFEVNAYPSASGLSVYLRDITDRKESENRLTELNRSLEKQAKELAASNAELEQFAFIASHDLQEPLRMVTSFLALLEKKYSDQLDEKAKKYIYFATDGASRMRQIIHELLEFSRVGRLEINKSEVDLNGVLNDVYILNKKKIEAKDANLTWGIMPTLVAEESSVKRLFNNLVSNALKYHNKGSKPLISIEAEEKEKAWEITVKDNGIGINPEYHQKIFNIFQRLHTNDEYTGTGIGLAICKKIVELHGGEIWVESQEGKGSTFIFTLPRG